LCLPAPSCGSGKSQGELLIANGTADLYKIAYGKYAVGAYNVNNLEQILGLFRGCIDSQAPFII